MRLEWIEFDNFRGIPSFSIELGDQAVFVGPNAIGKSSILSGLNLLLAASTAQILGTLTSADFTDPDRSISIAARLANLSDEELEAFPDEVDLGPPVTLTLHLEAQMSADGQNVSLLRQFPTSGHLRQPTREQLDTIGYRLVPATRTVTDLDRGRRSIVATLLQTLDLGGDEEMLSEMLAQFGDALAKSGALQDFKNELTGAIRAALPLGAADRQVQIMPPNRDDPLAGVGVGLEERGSTRPLSDHSDGVRATATLALYSMSSKFSNVVAVDEPELHLHPVAQRVAARLLSASSNQVLMATHSSHVASTVAPEALVVFGPAGEPRRLPPGALPDRDRFLARWWGPALLEPLAARTVLVVEGVADRLVVEGAARAIGLSLDGHAVVLIDLQGAKTFEVAYNCLGPKGFGIELRGLVDAAQQADWAAVVDVLPADLEAHGFFTCDADLEDMYCTSLGASRVIELLLASGFFSEPAICKGCAAPNLASITDAGITSLVGRKRLKVSAAAAIGLGLTEADARKLQPIMQLLGA